MYPLLKKELQSFFGSLMAYLIILVFLLLVGLFLWVFPNHYNLLDANLANLDAFFLLAPWFFLFLIPATTMRLFSEESKMGTMEILATKPLIEWKIVLAKFLASLVVVTLACLSVWVYAFSLNALSFPAGDLEAVSAYPQYSATFAARRRAAAP
mgnify:CR=1 FL=1